MLRDVDSRDSKPEMQIRVMFTVARIAATVFQSGETITNASPLSSEINSSVVSLYTYGVSCSIDSRASLLEGYLGGVEVYGVDNGPLLSFGDFKDVSSVSEFRMQCFQGNSSLALSFSTQYIGKNDPSSQSMQDETNRFRSYESFAAADTHGNINHYLVYPSQQHLVIESKLSELTVHWSPDCITCMLNCLDLFDMSKYLSTGDPFQAEKRRLALQSIYAGSTSVLEEKLKVSMSVVLRSVKLQFPIQQSGTKSPTLSDSSSQVLELGFEDLQFISGDYLETLLLEFDKNRFANDESATAITDVGMGDALPRLLSTVQSIRNPLVHPLVFMLRGVFMKYVQTSDLHGQQVVGTILKSPWLADGAISMSSMPSHRDFTDLRCDLHLGPLEIQLRTQVYLSLLHFD